MKRFLLLIYIWVVVVPIGKICMFRDIDRLGE